MIEASAVISMNDITLTDARLICKCFESRITKHFHGGNCVGA